MPRTIKSLLATCTAAILFALPVFAQEGPVIVQPGAPGQPTKILPASTTADFPSYTKKDVEFMQGMIHHHAQAVEMSALIKERTTYEKLITLGARISHTQEEEIAFMRRWLRTRGEKLMLPMPDMGEMKDMKDHKGHMDNMMMPGMLTPKQMEALRNAKDMEFVRLWLEGMIQHHIGALVMVDELHKAGAGEDPEMFTFATDVDSGQRAEIKVMREMLKEIE